jgi:hypothetical protein
VTTSNLTTENIFTCKRNSESFPERPVRRPPHRPITYVGQYGGTGEADTEL